MHGLFIRLSHWGFAASRPIWFSARGELRVAHSGPESKAGRTLETMYLRPLRGILQQCGRILNPPTAFLLNLELKERSRPAYDSLLVVLARYPELVEASSESVAPIEILLVGWSPPSRDPGTTVGMRLGLQYKITSLTSTADLDLDKSVRLISLDYGRTIRWSGRGPVPQHAAMWLERVGRVKGTSPRRLARAYNAPAHTAVYRLLLQGGIDLIGTGDLQAAQRVLRQLWPVDSR